MGSWSCFFFFQAEDGIRDYKVTGVQTCALPISLCVQQAADDGRIARFVPCDTQLNVLQQAPLREADGKAWSARIGRSMIYAFHRLDGSFAIGTREEVEAAVRVELLNLHSQPFTWAEAARFVRD